MTDKPKGKREKFVAVPLNAEQVRLAKEIIKENHPLAETPKYVSFPVLTPCKSCLEDHKTHDHNEPLIEDDLK